MSEQPIYIIGYARVSTPKQAVEGESLEMQADHIRSFATGKGWTLFPDNHVFQEPFTATTDSRPIYDSILKLIKANKGKVRYVVIKVIDRFSREGSMKYQQMKLELSALGVELRDIGGVIQASVNSLENVGFKYAWSENSPSAISELVLAETAKHERSSILTRLVGAQIKLTQDGYHIGRADDGYIVKRVFVDGKKKCAQFPDPERAHFFREMFMLRAEGVHSDTEIVDRINRMGFRTKAWCRWDPQKTKIIGRRPGIPLTVKQFQKIILRPVYCGIVCEKWTKGLPVRAKGGESIISIDTFNRANRSKIKIGELEDGTVSLRYNDGPERVVARRHRFRPTFAYKNVVVCPHCGRPLLASASRGKSGAYFGAYHCTRNHKRYAIAQTQLDRALNDYLSGMTFGDGFFEQFAKVLVAMYHDEQSRRTHVAAETARRLADLEDKKERLIEAFAHATLPAMRTDLEHRVESLDKQLRGVRAEAHARDVGEKDIEDLVSYARKLMEHPARILTHIGNIKEQLALFRLFFEVPPTYEEILNGTPKLALTFRLFRASIAEESQLMNVPGLGWNTVRDEILTWKRSCWAIDAVRMRSLGAPDNKISGGVTAPGEHPQCPHVH